MSLNVKFINASAGSGKTHELMERMARMVCEEKIPANKILATTFTEKAAAELRARVRAKLLEKGLVAEAQSVFNGLIGTVNGICGRLVEEHAFELGLRPGLQVIPSGDGESEDYAEIIFARAAETVFEEYEDRIRSLAARFDLLPENASSGGTSWKKMAKNLGDGLRMNNIAPGSNELRACVAISLEQARKIFPGTDERRAIECLAASVSAHGDLFSRLIMSDRPDGLKFGEPLKRALRDLQSFAQNPTWSGIYERQNAENAGLPSLGRDSKNNRIKESADGVAITRYFSELWTGDSIIPKNFMSSIEIREEAEKMIELLFEIAAKCVESYQLYKKKFGLIDFIDQETLALRLFQEHGNGSFGKAFKERVQAIMVDEFQDTSPLQMAIFLEMHKLVENVTFVGDPKQAIYEFRGTDPTLMMNVARSVKETAKQLPNSWRSQQKLVDFVNAVFVPTFSELDMKANEIALTLPDERVGKSEWNGGEFESWMLDGSTNGTIDASIAEAIVAYIQRDPDRANHLNDIAVLGRSRHRLKAIGEELVKRGVSISWGAKKLNEQLECQLAMAAYRYAVNPYDTVALAVLVAHFVQPNGWLENLSVDAELFIAQWRENPRIRALGTVGDRTAGELLDHVIAAIGLDKHVLSMPEGDHRLRNLTALRDLCARYMQESAFGGYPATPLGFVAYVSASKESCASAEGGSCVQLTTYHGSKGLEWSTVILTELDKQPQTSAFAQTVVSREFDVDHPLSNRWLRVVPNPLGGKIVSCKGDQRKYEQILAYMHSSTGCMDCDEQAESLGWREMRRLMYVGMTRAKERLVFALGFKNEKADDLWLKKLAPNQVTFTWQTSDFEIPLDNKTFPIRVFDHQESDPNLKLAFTSANYQDDVGFENREAVRAYRPPSSEEGRDVPVELKDVVEIGEWFAVEKSDEESAALGDAMHNYYAVAVPGDDDPALAAELLARWNVEKLLSAEQLVKSGANLRKYIRDRWPNAEILTEIPMTYSENGQVFQGFIDMLVKDGDSYVLLDHKTGSSRKYEDVAKYYAGQQVVYKKAIEKAFGVKILKAVLHLPVCGVCLECML